jgi:hypothetical protein
MNGAGKQLPPVLHATIDVTANVVGIVLLKIACGHRVAGQHSVAEARCESFDLGFDSCRHIDPVSVGNVTMVGQRMFMLQLSSELFHSAKTAFDKTRSFF